MQAARIFFFYNRTKFSTLFYFVFNTFDEFITRVPVALDLYTKFTTKRAEKKSSLKNDF
eukprot:SAG11_NODE_1642_length_4529_cov_2.274944_9_plen_59_part_00